MDFSKLKNRLLVVLCLFIVFFPFWCVRGLCAETEEVEVSSAYLSMTTGRNYFASSSSGTIGYFPIEKGYIYHITNTNTSSGRLVAISDDMPDVNVTYTILTTIEPQSTFDYISNSNTIMYISYGSSSQATVTREKLTGMDDAVSDLVTNVGLSNLWGVFNISINYIVIVILFAFGLFIIISLIKKFRKGKGGI